MASHFRTEKDARKLAAIAMVAGDMPEDLANELLDDIDYHFDKVKSLGMYRGVMRPYPHPRSAEYITGLAAVRGSQWGVNYAESFEVVLRSY